MNTKNFWMGERRNFRRFMFTINDVEHVAGGYDQLYHNLQEMDKKRVKFIIWSLERAPETGHLHIQGYVRLANTTTVGSVKSMFHPAEAHIDVANGTEKQCADYCRKADTHVAGPWSEGDEQDKGQGSRVDCSAVVQAIKGGTWDPVNNDEQGEFYMKHSKGVSQYESMVNGTLAPRRDNIECLVICSETAIGKSQWARDYAEAHGFAIYSMRYAKQSNVQWWFGYDKQEILLLDEFEDTKLTAQSFNEIVDKYPYQVRTGTDTWKWAKWETVIVCTNSPPASWYGWESSSVRGAIMRRCNRIIFPLTRFHLLEYWEKLKCLPHARWTKEAVEKSLEERPPPEQITWVPETPGTMMPSGSN